MPQVKKLMRIKKQNLKETMSTLIDYMEEIS